MCGRYASARKRIELLEEFSVERDRTTQPLAPDYNVAPTKSVYAVLTRDGKDAGSRDPAGMAATTSGQRRPASCGWSAGAWCPPGPRTSPSAAA